MLKVGVITKKFKDGVNKMHVKCSIKHLFGIESQFWKHEMHCLRMVTLKMPIVLIRNLQMNKCSVTETVGGKSSLDSLILVEESALLLQTR